LTSTTGVLSAVLQPYSPQSIKSKPTKSRNATSFNAELSAIRAGASVTSSQRGLRGQARISEAPRGELSYYVRITDSPNPKRVKWRFPSFLNWDALGIMLNKVKISDIAIIVNSIGPCISCTER
jgi:Ni,Fe-hydrogenase III large subunit